MPWNDQSLGALSFERKDSNLAAHDRRKRILGGAAAEGNRAHGLRAAADRIVVQMHAARDALAGDIDARATLNQRADRLFQPCRNTARAEGFENDLGITVQRGEKGRVEVGRELDEQYMRVERRRRGRRRRCRRSWRSR